MPKQYSRVSLGHDSSGRDLTVDARTDAMLDIAYRKADLSEKKVIVQGSYRAGAGAAASAGTHDGGGVVDLRTWHLTEVERRALLWQLRLVGFAAWYRHQGQGFDPHIHAVDIGNRQLAPSAKAQVTAYLGGRNGLASNGADDFRRPKTIEPFDYRVHVENQQINKHIERLRNLRSRLAGRKVSRRRLTRAIRELRKARGC